MRNGRTRRIGFFDELEVTTGTLRDWAYFARWHYRGHAVGCVRLVTVLWHGPRPVGVCVFTTSRPSLLGRNRHFGTSGRQTRLSLMTLNRQVSLLARVVLHPTYRGAGIAAAFIRRSCAACPYPWIETLAQMGRVNPFFEKAGFVRIDVPAGRRPTGGARRPASPVYYVYDNRANVSDGGQ